MRKKIRVVLLLVAVLGICLQSVAYAQTRGGQRTEDVDTVTTCMIAGAPGKLAVGKSTQLKPNIKNSVGDAVKAKCSWKSSNSSVLAVGESSGKIRAKKSGSAKVTLTAKTKYATYKRSVTVKVVSHAEHIKIRSGGQTYMAYVYPYSKRIVNPETGEVKYGIMKPPDYDNTWRALAAIPCKPDIRITIDDKTMDYTCFVYDRKDKNVCYSQASLLSQKLKKGEYMVRINCTYPDKDDGMQVNGHGYFKIKV